MNGACNPFVVAAFVFPLCCVFYSAPMCAWPPGTTRNKPLHASVCESGAKDFGGAQGCQGVEEPGKDLNFVGILVQFLKVLIVLGEKLLKIKEI